MATVFYRFLIPLILLGFALVATVVEASDLLRDASVKVYTDIGTGSGVIVRPSGVILTNFHVVDDAKEVAIELNNGEHFYDVGMIASDARRDIAVLKISGFDLPSAKLGNSNNVVVGENVTVIGSPRGFIGTLTQGVISAKRTTNGYELFQLDAPLSQGSSGGGVFDADGNLVALAVGLIEDAQNLNFAVPINYARGLSFSSEVKTQFRSGDQLITSSEPRSRILGQEEEIAGLSSREIFRIIELVADAEYEETPVLGEAVRGVRDLGDLGVFLSESELALYISWSMEDVDLNEDLLKELLYINEVSGSAKLGLDRDDNSLFIGFEGTRGGLTESSLRDIVANIVETDVAAVGAITGEFTEGNDFERGNVALSSRTSKTKRVKLLGGDAEIRVPISWDRAERELNPDDGMLTLQYNPTGDYFPAVRIIAEPALKGMPLDSLPELLKTVYLGSGEDNDLKNRVVLASGRHLVGQTEHYWERTKIISEGIEFFVDFSVYSGEKGMIQFIGFDIKDDGEAMEAADLILSQFKLVD